LSGNLVSGTIPTTVGQASQLTYLSLNNNLFTGTVPTQIGQLSSLLYLYLNTNSLSGPIPTQFGKLQNIEYIFIQNNELSGTIPDTISNLASLNTFNAGRNLLGGTLPSSLATNPNLVTLSVSQNNMSGVLPDALGTLQSLATLQLSFNLFTGTIPASWSNFGQRLVFLGLLYSESVIPIQGNCFPQGLSPAECQISQQIQFSCDCPAPPNCGACACYNTSAADICSEGLDQCRDGCTCVPTGKWYTCSCPAGVDAQPPETHCARNDECALYGCSVPFASCTEGKPNQRTCSCPPGWTVLGDGKTLLIADEVFAGCSGDDENCTSLGCYIALYEDSGLTTGQKVGIAVGVFSAATLLAGGAWAAGSAGGATAGAASGGYQNFA